MSDHTRKIDVLIEKHVFGSTAPSTLFDDPAADYTPWRQTTNGTYTRAATLSHYPKSRSYTTWTEEWPDSRYAENIGQAWFAMRQALNTNDLPAFVRWWLECELWRAEESQAAYEICSELLKALGVKVEDEA